MRFLRSYHHATVAFRANANGFRSELLQPTVCSYLLLNSTSQWPDKSGSLLLSRNLTHQLDSNRCQTVSCLTEKVALGECLMQSSAIVKNTSCAGRIIAFSSWWITSKPSHLSIALLMFRPLSGIRTILRFCSGQCTFSCKHLCACVSGIHRFPPPVGTCSFYRCTVNVSVRWQVEIILNSLEFQGWSPSENQQ